MKKSRVKVAKNTLRRPSLGLGSVMPSKLKVSLETLIAQCDQTVSPPQDVLLWDNAKPVGVEVW
jgi:hypothetical protein